MLNAVMVNSVKRVFGYDLQEPLSRHKRLRNVDLCRKFTAAPVV
jgi:hypothetical protein